VLGQLRKCQLEKIENKERNEVGKKERRKRKKKVKLKLLNSILNGGQNDRHAIADGKGIYTARNGWH